MMNKSRRKKKKMMKIMIYPYISELYKFVRSKAKQSEADEEERKKIENI
jgi:hypothetical protein